MPSKGVPSPARADRSLGRCLYEAENLVGHHLRTLRDAELADSRRDGKIVFYALTELGRKMIDAQVLTAGICR
jgi:DNA-binding transcriptional ArsR family regulator